MFMMMMMTMMTIFVETSQIVHCMRCRIVRSSACLVGMSWRTEPRKSQMMVSVRLKQRWRRRLSPTTQAPCWVLTVTVYRTISEAGLCGGVVMLK